MSLRTFPATVAALAKLPLYKVVNGADDANKEGETRALHAAMVLSRAAGRLEGAARTIGIDISPVVESFTNALVAAQGVRHRAGERAVTAAVAGALVVLNAPTLVRLALGRMGGSGAPISGDEIS